jgi:hypothetical protein
MTGGRGCPPPACRRQSWVSATAERAFITLLGGAAANGSLLIGDDTGGTIWRVSYTGPKDRASDRETTMWATQR